MEKAPPLPGVCHSPGGRGGPQAVRVLTIGNHPLTQETSRRQPPPQARVRGVPPPGRPGLFLPPPQRWTLAVTPASGRLGRVTQSPPRKSYGCRRWEQGYNPPCFSVPAVHGINLLKVFKTLETLPPGVPFFSREVPPPASWAEAVTHTQAEHLRPGGPKVTGSHETSLWRWFPKGHSAVGSTLREGLPILDEKPLPPSRPPLSGMSFDRADRPALNRLWHIHRQRGSGPRTKQALWVQTSSMGRKGRRVPRKEARDGHKRNRVWAEQNALGWES